jgi:hypothetical protein
MKKRIHKRSQIDRDPATTPEGSKPTPERDPHDPDSAGQLGDLQGLSGAADADSESVDELIEEGQSYEAKVVNGGRKCVR